jgi:cell division protease FtsH
MLSRPLSSSSFLVHNRKRNQRLDASSSTCLLAPSASRTRGFIIRRETATASTRRRKRRANDVVLLESSRSARVFASSSSSSRAPDDAFGRDAHHHQLLLGKRVQLIASSSSFRRQNRTRTCAIKSTNDNNNNNNNSNGKKKNALKDESEKNKEEDPNVPSDVKNSFSEETEEEKFETNRRRNFSLLEFTKRRVKLFFVIVQTVFSDAFKSVGMVLRTRLAKFILSLAFFVGSGLGIRNEHAKRHPPAPAVKSVPYSTFLKSVQKGEVTKVRFEEGTTRLLFDVKESSSLVLSSASSSSAKQATTEGASKQRVLQSTTTQKYMKRRYQTRRLPNDLQLISKLEKANVEFSAVSPAISTFASKGALATAFVWLPIIPLLFWLRGIVRKQNGLQDGKKKKDARDDSKGPKTTFKDVAGVDEAKQELYELVQMLRNEERYKEVRHRLPAGCLLVGPPGTGKTLLARAVAGEAGVAFFPVAASEFVELFVGRGAARVRELFAEARKKAPCVVFIDELDAIGARRGAGLNEERDQTLNQMLVEMDGFNKAAGVLVLAATNRPDALDPALTRPGRLTRRVFVGPPTTSGRAQILAVHLRGMRLKEPLGQICEAVARQTPGFTGAELANACNEAALLAARNGKDACGYEELMEGVERTRNGVGAGVWGGGKVDPSKVLSDLRARFLGDFDPLDTNNNNTSDTSNSSDISNRGGRGGGGGSRLKDEYLGQGVSISQGPS